MLMVRVLVCNIISSGVCRLKNWISISVRRV